MRLNKKFFVVIPVVIFMFFLMGMALHCEHDETYVSLVKKATCSEMGQVDVICAKCNAILENQAIEILDHVYGEFTITHEPGPDTNGLKIRVCSVCQKEDRCEYLCSHESTYNCVVKEANCYTEGREYVICNLCDTVVERIVLEKLPHEVTYTTVIKEATCYETGVEAVICEKCELTVEEHTLDLIACSYGDWIYTKYATPIESGIRYKECNVCGKKNFEEYNISFESNTYICIPGTEVCGDVVISSFTQSAVNSYDMIYSESSPYFRDINQNNPFVIGHNYGTLGNLYQVEVGDTIYLSLDGKLEVYNVVISEFSMQNSSHTDIIGQTSGCSMWDNLGTKTLHLYTCHGGNNGRWLVLATLVV